MENADKMTPAEFKAERREMDLSVRDLAWILNTSEKTIRNWERDDGIGPNPVAVRVLIWFTEGFRPEEWPEENYYFSRFSE